MILFSIIIPSFNDARNLPITLDNILNQSRNDVEIIIIDDDSKDTTPQICNKYKNLYKNIIVIRNEVNLGPGRSRNVGVAKAKGDCIIFLDSDDLLSDDSLDELALFINNKNFDLIMAKWTGEDNNKSNNILFGNTDVTNSNDPVSLINYINQIDYYPNVCWSYVLKRNFIIDNNICFQNATVGEDIDFVVKILCTAKTIDYFKNVFYIHKGSGRLSKSIDLLTCYGFIRLVVSIAEFLYQKDYNPIKYQFIITRIDYIWNMLGIRLTLLNDNEINQINTYFEGIIKSNSVLTKYLIERIIIKDDYERDIIIKKKELIINNVLKLLYNRNPEQIFVFCASIDSLSICTILSKNNYNIVSIFDNNPKLWGEKYGKFLIQNPTNIHHDDFELQANYLIIVCNPSQSVYQSIYSQLTNFGISSSKIIHSKPAYL
jgi:glycosyltransferase involved in cell wall biosynthesis